MPVRACKNGAGPGDSPASDRCRSRYGSCIVLGMDSQTLLRLGWGAVRYHLWGTRTPLNVMVAVTNRCPAQCVYCDIPARKQREQTTAELLETPLKWRESVGRDKRRAVEGVGDRAALVSGAMRREIGYVQVGDEFIDFESAELAPVQAEMVLKLLKVRAGRP